MPAAAWVAARAQVTPQAVRRWRADPAYLAAAAESARRLPDDEAQIAAGALAHKRPCLRPDCYLITRPAVLRLDRCGADDCPRREVPFRFV
jgi:hypothetical protein